MPSFRHHDHGNLYIKFDVKFPTRIGGDSEEGGSMTPEQVKALESVLPPRVQTSAPPPNAMMDDFQLEDFDPQRDGGRRGMNAMDEDDDDMHPGAERVQCASQ
jgi:DnaJ family protein A protein 2